MAPALAAQRLLATVKFLKRFIYGTATVVSCPGTVLIDYSCPSMLLISRRADAQQLDFVGFSNNSCHKQRGTL